MKKMLVLAIVMLISMTAANVVLSQSLINSSDKSFIENKKTDRLIKKEIKYYEMKLKKSASDSILSAYYRREITRLENQISNLISGIAANPQRQTVKLQSRDPQKVAEAYLLMKYADGTVVSKSNSNGDSIIILNYSSDPIRVDIEYCGHQIDSRPIKGASYYNDPVKLVVKVPGPGNYQLIYTNLNNGNITSSKKVFVDGISRQDGYALLSTYSWN